MWKYAEITYLEVCPTTRDAPGLRYRIKIPFFINAKNSILNVRDGPESLKLALKNDHLAYMNVRYTCVFKGSTENPNDVYLIVGDLSGLKRIT